MSAIKDYNNIKWEELFVLDESSPSGLINKISRGKARKGATSGTRYYRKNGAPDNWSVSFNHKGFRVHRILWILTHGSLEDSVVIDHLDGNPFNNKIENLALKTYKGNQQNMKLFASSKTGITGVNLIFNKNKTARAYWRAIWSDNYKKYAKNFSILQLGDDIAKKMAVEYRAEQILRLNASGELYTGRY